MRARYVKALIEGEWHVLFRPKDKPHHYLSVATFHDEGRADVYADVESSMAEDGEPNTYQDIANVSAIEAPKPTPLIGAKLVSSPTPAPLQRQVDQAVEVNKLTEAPAPTPTIKIEESRAKATEVEPGNAEGMSPRKTDNDQAGVASRPEAGRSAQGEVGEPASPSSKPVEKINTAPATPNRSEQQQAAFLDLLRKRGGDRELIHIPSAEVTKETGIPEGSIFAVAKALVDKGRITTTPLGATPKKYQILDPDAQHGKADKPTPSVPAASKSPASAMSSRPRDDGAVQGRCEPTAPPIPAPLVPRPVPKTEPARIPESKPLANEAPRSWEKAHSSPRPTGELPFRMSTAGQYIIAGKVNQRVEKPVAAAFQCLVDNWGNGIKADTLMTVIATQAGIQRGEAMKNFKSTMDQLNLAIEAAGLVALRKEDGWALVEIVKEGEVA